VWFLCLTTLAFALILSFVEVIPEGVSGPSMLLIQMIILHTLVLRSLIL
jgi:hypothetical protein